MTDRPGDLLLSWWVVAAVVVLLVNDHVLKAWIGGTATGKLSDVAGVFVLPLLTLALVEALRSVLRRRWRSTRRDVLAHITVVGVGFALVKTVPVVRDAYEYMVGLLRALATGSLDSVTPILVYLDATDLLVLPVMVGTYVVAMRARPVQTVEPATAPPADSIAP